MQYVERTTYSYHAPWPIFGVSWSQVPGSRRIAISSFMEDSTNQIQLLDVPTTTTTSTPNAESASATHNATHNATSHAVSSFPAPLIRVGTAEHNLPPTRIQFAPWTVSQGLSPPANENNNDHDEWLATSGDALRLWRIGPRDHTHSDAYKNNITSRQNDIVLSDQETEDSSSDSPYYLSSPTSGTQQKPTKYQIRLETQLCNVRRSNTHSKQSSQSESSSSTSRSSAPPLTSFDWHPRKPLIVTASIDTTCAIWDIQKQTLQTQLIAHDREVFDVGWNPGNDSVFCSVGRDGSLRLFDLRSLEHSTILYETVQTPWKDGMGGGFDGTETPECQSNPPLLKLEWNPNDTNLIATFAMDSNSVLVIDVRNPALPLYELTSHVGPVNTIHWSPISSNTILSGGDDHQLLIYTLSQQDQEQEQTILPTKSYNSKDEINCAKFHSSGEWVGVSAGSGLEVVRV